jgi:two-component system, sensor histidine kinase
MTASQAAHAPEIGAVSPSEFGSFRRMEQFRSVLEQTPGSLAGNLIAGLVIGSTFWSVAPAEHMAGWAGVMLTVWLLRLAHYLRYRRARDSVDATTLLQWRRSWSAIVLVQGACWGAASWLFYGLGSDFHLTALMVTMCSYCVGAVQLLATQTSVFTLFAAFTLTPLVWRVAADISQPYHTQLAFILCLAFCTAVVLARTYRGAMAQAISLKVRAASVDAISMRS